MKKSNILYIIVAWTLLIYIGYNVLTAEAALTDPKEVCTSHDGEWKKNGGECKFEKDSKYPKEENQADFEHYMAEEGLWDGYATKQADKKAEKESKKACDGIDDAKWTETGCEIKAEDEDAPAHEDDTEVIEDWANEVSSEEKSIGEEHVDYSYDDDEQVEEEDNSESESEQEE